MKHTIKALAVFITFTFLLTALTGCLNKSGSSSTSNPSRGKEELNTMVYPMKTNVTLRYWTLLNGNLTQFYKNLGDTPFAKELEKRTGVKIQYIHPPEGQEREVFNLMVASNDLPDIIEYDWLNYFSGGPEYALNSKLIISHNEIIDKYAVNLKKLLQDNDEIDKMCKTDNGNYYGFPFIRGDPVLNVYYGPVIRHDWLVELGLESPETIDEWYTVLKAFKEKKGATAPFSYEGSAANPLAPFSQGVFSGAFGVNTDFYIDGDTVKFSPIENGYKDFLDTMSKWYKDGLLDSNFAVADRKTLDAKIITGRTGATVGGSGSGIGKWQSLLLEKEPGADLRAASYPALVKGGKSRFGQRDLTVGIFTSTTITTGCKNVEVAAKWLDYGYGKEGQVLNNFGVEGVSYEMVNGYPKMTDEVMKNPDNMTISQAWSKFARATYGGAFVQQKEYIEQYYVMDRQKEAIEIWRNTDVEKHMLPPLSPSREDSSRFAKVMNDVRTYIVEYSLKVIMGAESTEGFDSFVEQLGKMGIEEAIAIEQAAYERYKKR